MRLEITAMEQRLAAAAGHPIGTGLPPPPRDGRGRHCRGGGVGGPGARLVRALKFASGANFSAW